MGGRRSRSVARVRLRGTLKAKRRCLLRRIEQCARKKKIHLRGIRRRRLQQSQFNRCLCVCSMRGQSSFQSKKKSTFKLPFPPTHPGLLLRRTSLILLLLLLTEGGKSLGAKGRPPGATKPHPCPRPAPPRSPQVEGQRHGEDDPGQHEERQPGLQKGPAAGGRRRDTAVSDAPHRKYRVSPERFDLGSQARNFGYSS